MTQYMPQHITQEFLDMIKLPDPTAKRLNYLMIMPVMVDNDSMWYQFPYGFGLVSSALKASGRNVFTLNINYKTDIDKLIRESIIKNHIDVVLTGGISGQYSVIKYVLDTCKECSPDIITIVGGGIITADPVVAMMALETADYGVIGEGEVTVNELAFALENGNEIDSVPGIILKTKMVTSPPPPPPF
ncbi:MAG: cobalamin-dependent protein [Prevotellaceae bacterium]|jgi:radical SAM superfamily enzyme YgiQ (UPF0313 family)|nr:cobalamin-dependent protein [Prevotellaceae bacterium]